MRVLKLVMKISPDEGGDINIVGTGHRMQPSHLKTFLEKEA